MSSGKTRNKTIVECFAPSSVQQQTTPAVEGSAHMTHAVGLEGSAHMTHTESDHKVERLQSIPPDQLCRTIPDKPKPFVNPAALPSETVTKKNKKKRIHEEINGAAGKIDEEEEDKQVRPPPSKKQFVRGTIKKKYDHPEDIQPNSQTPKDAVIAYTDGSCRGNGRGAEAAAGIGVFFGYRHPWFF